MKTERVGVRELLLRLLASGQVISARLDLSKLGPPPERPRNISISEALAEQRREGLS